MYEFVLADYIISSLILVIGVSILVLFLGTVTAWTVTTYNFKEDQVSVKNFGELNPSAVRLMDRSGWK